LPKLVAEPWVWAAVCIITGLVGGGRVGLGEAGGCESQQGGDSKEYFFYGLVSKINEYV